MFRRSTKRLIIVRVTRPIVIVGTGRSGTTLLYQMLALNPALGWFCAWTNRWPRLPYLAFFSRPLLLSTLEPALMLRPKGPRPSEALNLWRAFFPGFVPQLHDHTRSDDDAIIRFRSVVKTHLRFQGRKRFLTKYVGFPNVALAMEVFDDPVFVYSVRDPRAVVLSMQKQRWWLKDDPQRYQAMSAEERSSFYSGRYLELYRALKTLPEGHETCRFEDLVDDPVGTIADLCDRLRLPVPERYKRIIGRWPIDLDAAHRWSQQPETDLPELTHALSEPIQELGYS